MDDRKTPLPQSPFTEALKHNPKDNREEAERVYDAPDGSAITEANLEGGEDGDKVDGPGQDPVVARNVRKPLI